MVAGDMVFSNTTNGDDTVFTCAAACQQDKGKYFKFGKASGTKSG
jgi:hypothetical protein